MEESIGGILDELEKGKAKKGKAKPLSDLDLDVESDFGKPAAGKAKPAKKR